MLKETMLESKQVYSGDFLKIRRDSVRLPDGGVATREYVVHPGACVIVPILDDGQVVLERQYRYPVGREMIEFPAGKTDHREDPLVCAVRELHEETGYTASHWAHAGWMHLAIGYSDEVIQIYFAKGLIEGPRKLDDGEFLDVFTTPAQTLLQWCAGGLVTDAKTLVCALHLQQFLNGSKTLVWQKPPNSDTP